jgi:hypothetical protein
MWFWGVPKFQRPKYLYLISTKSWFAQIYPISSNSLHPHGILLLNPWFAYCSLSMGPLPLGSIPPPFEYSPPPEPWFSREFKTFNELYHINSYYISLRQNWMCWEMDWDDGLKPNGIADCLLDSQGEGNLFFFNSFLGVSLSSLGYIVLATMLGS